MHKGLFKNIFANWLGLITTVVVSFFLTPFILHRLGNTGYGLWVLVTGLTGYYGLLDFGIRSAITRYVARYAAQRDWDNLNRTVSTTIVSYSVVGLLIFLISLVVAAEFGSLFHVAPEWHRTAQLLLVIIGTGTAISIPVGVFAGVLEGMQQFTWLGVTQAVGVLVRAAVILLALSRGYGLLSLAFATIFTNLVTYVIYAVVATRRYPQIQVRWRYAGMDTFRTLARFGGVVFWISIAQQLRFQTDAVVIGAFVSMDAIAFFAIGSRLAAYMTDAVQTLAQVFTPVSSHFDATQDLDQLRRVLMLGNRYAAFVAFPLAVVLLVTGKSIIRVWVGPAYLSSYTVLAILAIPMMLYLAQAVSTKVLYGMARHGTLAMVLLVEGVANLILSVLLARRYGITGVALGTAIPLMCTGVLFLPRHLCRLLGLRARVFFREAYLYPVLVCLPFTAALWLTDRWISPDTYTQLLAVLVLGGTVYALSLGIYFFQKERPESMRVSHLARAFRRS